MLNNFSYLRLSAIVAFVSSFAFSASAQCGTIYHDDSYQIIFQKGQQLYSCNGLFFVTYEFDGNARVYYAPQSQVLWSSETADLDMSEYVFQTTGANSGSMTMGDDGNLVVYTGSGEPEFSTNTQGTDCPSSNVFFTDIAKEQLAQSVQNEQPAFAAALRSNPCILFNVVAQETGSTIAEIESTDTDSSAVVGRSVTGGLFGRRYSKRSAGPPNAIAARSGALKGKSVISEYKFIVLLALVQGRQTSNPNTAELVVASARIQKTWYYNGETVSNSAGGDPDKATIKGEASGLGTLMGYSWTEPSGSAAADAFAEYKGNGKGAHYSSRTARIEWKFPIVGGLISNLNVFPGWSQELYIKGKADGTLECRGGQSCSRAPLP